MSAEHVTVADGKYTVVIGVGAHAGQLRALRYGDPWQDLTGNNLVYWLAVELREARAKLAALDEPKILSTRAEFEADAEALDFDLTRRINPVAPEPWMEYLNPDTGHRWAGWLAARKEEPAND